MKLKPQSPQLTIWLLGCVFLDSVKHDLPKSQMLWGQLSVSDSLWMSSTLSCLQPVSKGTRVSFHTVPQPELSLC